MDLQSKILAALNSDTRQTIGEKTNIDPDSVEKIITTGVPMLLGGLGNNASDSQGASSLSNALESKHDGSLLDSIGDLFAEGDANNDGLKILSHVFGAKSEVAGKNIASKTGVDRETVTKVLSFVAPVVLAQLGKEKKDSNLDAGGLSELLKNQSTSNGNPLMDIATQILDKNGDGSMLDDLLGMFTKGGK